MKLDVKALRYMSQDEFRVLTAVEMGMKNHDAVPMELVVSLAGLRHGGAEKLISNLLRNKLVAHDRKHYDGYRLTYMGYDFLALRTFLKRGIISGVGSRIGVGKESDIYEVSDDEGNRFALKLHRLGRISFRNIKSKRDYMEHRRAASWLYLSRLAAMKEFAFMKALHEHGFPTPDPLGWNRHGVVMSIAPGYPMTQVKRVEDPATLYRYLLAMIVRLARHGLIHCDFNEFNLLIDDELRVTLIDFPQMVSVSHPNADMYFDRDVECVRHHFAKVFKYHPEETVPTLAEALGGDDADRNALDVTLRASGFTPQHESEFQELLRGQGTGEDEEEAKGEAGPGGRSDGEGAGEGRRRGRAEEGEEEQAQTAAPAPAEAEQADSDAEEHTAEGGWNESGVAFSAALAQSAEGGSAVKPQMALFLASDEPEAAASAGGADEVAGGGETAPTDTPGASEGVRNDVEQEEDDGLAVPPDERPVRSRRRKLTKEEKARLEIKQRVRQQLDKRGASRKKANRNQMKNRERRKLSRAVKEERE